MNFINDFFKFTGDLIRAFIKFTGDLIKSFIITSFKMIWGTIVIGGIILLILYGCTSALKESMETNERTPSSMYKQ